MFDDESLAQFAYDLGVLHRTALEAFQALVVPIVADIEAAESLLVRRLCESNATELLHNSLKVTIERKKELVKYIDVLRELCELLPAEETAKAIYPDKPQPKWNADARVCKALAKRFGGKVKDIVERGIVDSYGPPRLVITARETL